MTYGYVKGAELTAIRYYESLLPNVEDSKERSKIDQLIQDLSKILADERAKCETPQISNSANLPVTKSSDGSWVSV
jgi:hypothetical protein